MVQSNYLGVVILLFFVSLTLVSAGHTTQISLDEGIKILFPHHDVYAVNDSFTLIIHAFNYSTQHLDNTTTDCYVTLVDDTGQVLYDSISNFTLDSSVGYFNWQIPENTLQYRGHYSYVFECNATGVVGSLGGEILANPLGDELTQTESILYIVYIIGIIFLFLIFLYGSLVIPYSNSVSDDGIVNINLMKYLKVVCIFMLYVVTLFFTGTMQSIFNYYLIHDNAGQFFNYIYWILLSFMFPVIVVSLLMIVFKAVDDVKIKRGMDRVIREFT